MFKNFSSVMEVESSLRCH